VAVVDAVKNKIPSVNEVLKAKGIQVQISEVRDLSRVIRLNIADVRESIVIGIILCIIVVFFFLGSVRSTFITGMALPNSLIGGFIIMFAMGFSINILTLLALSLAVGLLIDDAIVVRENIFRHLEMGKDPKTAALDGTTEVAQAVIATTLVVIAVFGPISFLDGIVGQFFKQFGLTVVFTMLISLFDAFTVAPMLSAYMAGKSEHHKTGFSAVILGPFERFQVWLEDLYESVLKWVLIYRKTTLTSALVIFMLSMSLVGKIPKTFLPQADNGEFGINIELPTGTSLEASKVFTTAIEQKLAGDSRVELFTTVVGSANSEANKASIFVRLKPVGKLRTQSSSQLKDEYRENLTSFKDQAIISIGDIDIGGNNQKPLILNLTGDNLEELSAYAALLKERIAKVKGLADVEMNFRSGKPEYHVTFDRNKSENLGVSTVNVGAELRGRTEGIESAVFREKGIEYSIRTRFEEKNRDLRKTFETTLVPNQNFNMIPLNRIAQGELATGYSQINRQNKSRFIEIDANLAVGGSLGTASDEITKILQTEMKPPLGVDFQFEGQAKDFAELIANMLVAIGLGILFIYLVLASLYESFITPITILLALPLAMSGAMAALFMFGKTIDIFSLIGIILLLGVVAKNSILLVDYTVQLLEQGYGRYDALIKASRTRLRPILMTSVALAAGILPIAIGLTELGSQRSSMGVAIIGGVISSTFLTLLVVPAAFGYIDDFRLWCLKLALSFKGDKKSIHPVV
ncbi:MAG: efflux RND transporter permease subunit, partial [Pseudobdellovibrionaceae bacterium]